MRKLVEEYNFLRSIGHSKTTAWEIAKNNTIYFQEDERSLLTWRDCPEKSAGKINIQGRILAGLALARPNEKRGVLHSIARQIIKRTLRLDISKDSPSCSVAYSRNEKISKKNHKQRTCIRFGRFLKRYHSWIGLTDSEIAKAQQGFCLGSFRSLKIVSGQDATQIYRDVDSIKGLHSCMTGECAEYVAPLFEQNPEKLFLCLLYEDDSYKFLQARAKLFKNDDGTYALTRVYARSGPEGIDGQTAWREIIELLPGAINNARIVDYYKCTLDHERGDYMCYTANEWPTERSDGTKLEPMNYDRDGDSVIFREDGDYSCDNAEGEDPSCETRVRCCCCEERHEEDSITVIEGEDYCDDCRDSRFIWCEDIDEYVVNDYAVYDSQDGRYISEDNAVEIYNTDGEMTHKSNCTELDRYIYGSGSWALDQDVVKTVFGEIILEEDSVTGPDGKCYHKDDGSIPDDEEEEPLATAAAAH